MHKKSLKKLADKLMTVDEFAFDTETNTLRVQAKGEMDLVGISISFGEHDNYYIPTGHTFDEGQLKVSTVVKYLKPVFEREDVRIIGHNLKFDMHVLANVDIEIKTKDIFDTMVASWISDENREKGLKALTNVVYGTKQTKFDECIGTVTADEKKSVGLKASNKAPFYLVRIEIGAPYAIADSYWTWRHYCDWEMEAITEEEMDTIFYKVQMPFLRTLYNMERRGVTIDIERLKRMAVLADKYLEELEYDIVEIFGIPFKITSSQQLQEVLFGYCKVNKQGQPAGNMELIKNAYNFPIQSATKAGAPSTGGSELKALLKLTYKKDKRKQEGQKLVKLILKYKRLAKLKSAFIDGLIKQVYSDGKVHPSFNQLGTDSGRLSCSEPNLQQLPRPIEMDEYLDIKNWVTKNNIEVDEDDWEEIFEDIENLEYEMDYPTGEIKTATAHEVTCEYLAYLTEWREYNEDNVFWKYFEIRGAFIPDDSEEECVIALDFSNLEMRLLAHFSQDPYLMETFIHDHDAHGATAVNMFQLDCTPDEAKKKYKALRQIAKTINFLNTSPHTA